MITSIAASTIGGTARIVHARVVHDEALGVIGRHTGAALFAAAPSGAAVAGEHADRDGPVIRGVTGTRWSTSPRPTRRHDGFMSTRSPAR